MVDDRAIAGMSKFPGRVRRKDDGKHRHIEMVKKQEEGSGKHLLMMAKHRKGKPSIERSGAIGCFNLPKVEELEETVWKQSRPISSVRCLSHWKQRPPGNSEKYAKDVCKVEQSKPVNWGDQLLR